MTRAEVPEQLLADAKNYLNITWTDEATDDKLRGLISAGTVYLDGKYGMPADYAADGLPRTLLMEYVRYARDSALDVFSNNYQSMILNMQIDRQVSAYAVESPDATASE